MALASGKTIAVLMTRQDRAQLQWVADARAVAAQRRITLTEHWAEDSSVTQLRQFSDAVLRSACDGAVVLAVLTGPTSLIREAVSRGQPIVLVNRTATDMDETSPWSWPRLRHDFPKVLTATALPDTFDTGRMQARQLRGLLPRGGKILHITGDPTTSDASDRLRGFAEVLGRNALYVVSNIAGDCQPTIAESVCTRWLATMSNHSGFKLDLIAVQSETMLPGVRHAVERAASDLHRPELRKVPLTCIADTREFMTEVDRGSLAALVETPSRVAAAVELIADFWETNRIPIDPIVHLPVKSHPRLDQLKPCA